MWWIQRAPDFALGLYSQGGENLILLHYYNPMIVSLLLAMPLYLRTQFFVASTLAGNLALDRFTALLMLIVIVNAACERLRSKLYCLIEIYRCSFILSFPPLMTPFIVFSFNCVLETTIIYKS